jgi:hypothetical protein
VAWKALLDVMDYQVKMAVQVYVVQLALQHPIMDLFLLGTVKNALSHHVQQEQINCGKDTHYYILKAMNEHILRI